jgi:hypothetical protein
MPTQEQEAGSSTTDNHALTEVAQPEVDARAEEVRLIELAAKAPSTPILLLPQKSGPQDASSQTADQVAVCDHDRAPAALPPTVPSAADSASSQPPLAITQAGDPVTPADNLGAGAIAPPGVPKVTAHAEGAD